MMKPSSPREQRLIAILILVAVVALVWLAIVKPLLDGFAARAEERAALVVEHRHNQELAASLPLLKAAARRQRADAARFALPGASVDQAWAALRDLVRRAAVRNNNVMKSAQRVDSKPGWVALRVEGEMGLDQLSRFLETVENEQPVVLVTMTSIAANAAFQTGSAAPMEIQLEISAPYDAPASR